MRAILPEAEFMKVLYERARHLVSDEELDRVEKETGGRPLADILDGLRLRYALNQAARTGRNR